MKNWLKNLSSKIRSQQGTTLAELMIAVSIIALITPGLFAAFNAFIKVPAQLSAVLSSIGSVSHASEWISKDASMAQSVTQPSDPGYYITFKYTDEDGQHQIDYSYDSDEQSVIREETVGGTTTTFTIASGIEKYDRADLNVVTFQSGLNAPVSMLVGNLLSTHYAGADDIDRRADPYITVRMGSAENPFLIPPYQLFSAGSDKLWFKGWRVDARDAYANGEIKITGTVSIIKGSLTTPGFIELGSSKDTIEGDLRAGDYIRMTGGDITIMGDAKANGNITFKGTILGNLYANESVDISGNEQFVGSEELWDEGKYSNVLSIGDITFIGSGHEVWGGVKAEGTVTGLDKVDVKDPEYDEPLVALDDMPVYGWPLRVTPNDLIEGASNLFTFDSDVTIQYPDPAEVWQSEDILEPGVYFAGDIIDGVYDPKYTITLKNSSWTEPTVGNVTFVAEQIKLGFEKPPGEAPEDLTQINNFELTSYNSMGILFYATGISEGGQATIDMDKLYGVEMEGIVYAPKGMIKLEGKKNESTFRFSGWSSLIGHIVYLAANTGTLSFASIELLDPDDDSPLTDGPADTPVMVSGMGFHGDSDIGIFFGEVELPLFVTTEADGTFSTTFDVPTSSNAGFYEVRAIDEEGSWASAFFEVTLSP